MSSRDLCIGDPDPRLRSALAILFGHAGWSVRLFEGGEALLTGVLDHPPDGVLIDIHDPAQTGLNVISALRAQGHSRPVVAMSNLSEVAIVVAAIKCGADDFVQKPCRPEVLYAAVERAADEWRERSLGHDDALARPFVGHAMLTTRETDILRGIAAGSTAREAAATLNISPRTVEFHRAKILQKFGARNAADLMRIVLSTAGNC